MKISQYVCVHIKTLPWIFHIYNPKDLRVIYARSLQISQKIDWFLTDSFYCLWMFVNKRFTISRVHISKSKTCCNIKSSAYHFHVKTKILIDFQICINVPLSYRACIHWRLCYWCVCEVNVVLELNPFLSNAPFPYPLKTSEKIKVFWWFKGAEKWCIGNKWVKMLVLKFCVTVFFTLTQRWTQLLLKSYKLL